MSVDPHHLLAHDRLGAEFAYHLVRDELRRDGDPHRNLATFTTTWMERFAERLFADTAATNLADTCTSTDDGPAPVLVMERRCLDAIAGLWHAPETVGCSTVGSSEACMLAGLALKRRWQHERRGGDRPNLVLGANVQICWKKFCNYFDVEARVIDLDDRLTLPAADAAAACDADTIGVVAVLGSTLDGSYDDVAGLAAALDHLATRGGPDVPIHVDAASGGLVAPFLDPMLVWDFTLPRVASINTSGHKFGMVYPGLGWALWRDHAALPDDLVMTLDYLGGGAMETFGLNFSRPGSGVVAQYYEFVREGAPGLRRLLAEARQRAGSLADAIDGLPGLRVVSRGSDVPVVAFTTVGPGPDVHELSRRLRAHGWMVPAYPLPGRHRDTGVLRVVCRRDFSAELAAGFLRDLADVTAGGQQPAA